jgi:hypothetical protein
MAKDFSCSFDVMETVARRNIFTVHLDNIILC